MLARFARGTLARAAAPAHRTPIGTFTVQARNMAQGPAASKETISDELLEKLVRTHVQQFSCLHIVSPRPLQGLLAARHLWRHQMR